MKIENAMDEFYTKHPQMILVQMLLAIGILMWCARYENVWVDVACSIMFLLATLAPFLPSIMKGPRKVKVVVVFAIAACTALFPIGNPSFHGGPIPRETAEIERERDRVRLDKEWREFLGKVRDKDVVILNDYQGEGPRVFYVRKLPGGCIEMRQGMDVLRGCRNGLDTMRLDEFMASPPPTVIHEGDRLYEQYCSRVLEDRSSTK